MIIQPIIKGQVAKSCHPFGCDKAVADQIDFVQHAKEISNGPQKVLILGASSGFGLASRICLGFGGPKADTIGVALRAGAFGKGRWHGGLV
ncbi:hypothetical protein [uncultured Cohaesibacter sp.]|uniref:hypothetical protein n=1 Tax=uncultured Cohaesibacter sp. TaxID=1002546 RepID=UPI00292EB80E|nr:hypothetical protein [uncultured Cohaesibacter sp.]